MLHQAATRFLAASPLSRSSGGERLFRYLLDSTLAGLCDDSYVGRLTTNEMAGS